MKPEERMVSFDVISPFPSIPIDLANEVFTHLLLENAVDIPSDSIMLEQLLQIR